MKRQIANIAAGAFGVAIAATLVGTLLASHTAVPRGSVGTVASSVATASPLPSPLPTPTSTPTPTIVATITNPLPPPPAAPTAAPVPAPAPVGAAPASTSTPTPPPTTPTPIPSPIPSPTAPVPPPPPPPPSPMPCSWTVGVATLTSPGTWTDLGTWTGSTATSTSPVFIMAGSGWLEYTYQFTSACIGHAALGSFNAFSGATIYTTNITTTATQTQQANLAPNTQVDFTVTLT